HDDHRALGAVVDGEPGAWAQACCGGDIDEAAATLLAERRQGVHRREVDAFDVNGVDLVEIRLAYLDVGLAPVRPAGVVDHDIETAEGRLRRADEACPVLASRDVRMHERSLAASRGDFTCDPLAGRVANVRDHDAGAFFREALRDSNAEATARARDDSDLAFE